VKIIKQRVSESFEPNEYTDEVRSRMMGLIQQKNDGLQISMPTEVQAEAKIIDLMEALKASVGAKKSSASGKKAPASGNKATKKPPVRKTAARAARKASPTKAKSSPKSKAR
jgi:DNA end-binding protein Ku